MVRESRRGVRCVLPAHEGPREPRQVAHHRGRSTWQLFPYEFCIASGGRSGFAIDTEVYRNTVSGERG